MCLIATGFVPLSLERSTVAELLVAETMSTWVWYGCDNHQNQKGLLFFHSGFKTCFAPST